MAENKICSVDKEAMKHPACWRIVKGKAVCPECGKAMCPVCNRHNVSMRSTRGTGQWPIE